MSLFAENEVLKRNAPSEASQAYRCAAGGFTEEGLILRYLPLVKTVVDRIKFRLPSHVDFDDLYSAGLSGLIVAARRYNPEQSHVFEGYARRRIHGAVL